MELSIAFLLSIAGFVSSWDLPPVASLLSIAGFGSSWNFDVACLLSIAGFGSLGTLRCFSLKHCGIHFFHGTVLF